MRETLLGPDHPVVGDLLHNLGVVELEEGHPTEALVTFERARAIWEVTVGPEHPDMVLVGSNIGLALLRQGRLVEARERLRQTLALAEQIHGPSHEEVADVSGYLGSVALELEDLDEAEAYFRRSLEVRRAQLGPDHPNVAIALSNIGMVMAERGQLVEGRRQQEQAVALLEQADGGRGSPSLPMTLVRRGTLERKTGEPQRAVASLRRALELLPAGSTLPSDRAHAHLELARALWSDPAARTEARSQARAASDALGDDETPRAQALRVEIEDWLATTR